MVLSALGLLASCYYTGVKRVDYVPGPSDPAAEEIIRRMAQVYAECRTYEDTGSVKTVFIEDDRRRTVIKPFSTAYVRPDRFRFEFLDRQGEEEWDRYIVHSDPTGTRTWWDVRPGVENEEDLSLAIAGATGVSSGSAGEIATLLLPGAIWGCPVTALKGWKLLEERECDGGTCYRVEGGRQGEHPRVLWIGKNDLLLRKIEERTEFKDFRTEEVMAFSPVVNGEIDPRKLEFNPPAAGSTASPPSPPL
jgi:hypothetical protein